MIKWSKKVHLLQFPQIPESYIINNGISIEYDFFHNDVIDCDRFTMCVKGKMRKIVSQTPDPKLESRQTKDLFHQKSVKKENILRHMLVMWFVLVLRQGACRVA